MTSEIQETNRGFRYMTQLKLKVVTILVFVVGLFFILMGTEIMARQTIYHPDAVITVHNDTTDKNTQAYAVGKMQIYIDQTYRMEMPLWSLYVKTQGLSYNPSFNAIKDEGNSELSMLNSGENNNPNPFIMKLKIKNLDRNPIYLNAANFKIRDVHGNVFYPVMNWQHVMAEAGMFSGVDEQTEIQSGKEKVLWLVYSTPTLDSSEGGTYQEYVQINYDSDSDLFATKVEFPFNYTEDFPIGNYEDESDKAYSFGLILILGWLAICGAGYFRLSKRIEE